MMSRSGSKGFGLPPPGIFRSGHLPLGVVPLSREVDDAGSASDMDVTSEESESDVYGGRYSLDSSPQNDPGRPRGLAHMHTKGRPLPRHTKYTSDYSDVNSSMEYSGKTGGHGLRGVGKPVGGIRRAATNVYTEEDSDSAASSEFSSTQQASTRKLPNGKFHADDDTPSAPPFDASHQESKQNVNQIVKPMAQSKQSAADSIGSVSKSDVNSAHISFAVNSHDSAGKGVPENYTRNGTVEQSVGSSGPHPARQPTFHASTQGPWHSVLSYDACVRLCLNAWARGCMEAPVFLENECVLLRNAFGLQHILLQSEEEILAKRTSEVRVHKKGIFLLLVQYQGGTKSFSCTSYQSICGLIVR